jgi:hypothetical protein
LQKSETQLKLISIGISGYSCFSHLTISEKDRVLKMPIVCSVQGSTISLREAVEFSQIPGEFKGRKVIPVPRSKMNAAPLRTIGRSNSPERISKFRGCEAVMVAAAGEIAITSRSFVPLWAAVIAKPAPSE